MRRAFPVPAAPFEPDDVPEDTRTMALAVPSLIQRLRFRFFQPDHSVMVWLAAIVGILGGLCAVAFRKFIVFVQTTAWQMPAFTLDGLRAQPAWFLILVPTAGGLVIGLIIHFFAREAKGHGVPEVMEAVALHGGRIRPRLVVVKSLASAITIASTSGMVIAILLVVAVILGFCLNRDSDNPWRPL